MCTVYRHTYCEGLSCCVREARRVGSCLGREAHARQSHALGVELGRTFPKIQRDRAVPLPRTHPSPQPPLPAPPPLANRYQHIPHTAVLAAARFQLEDTVANLTLHQFTRHSHQSACDRSSEAQHSTCHHTAARPVSRATTSRIPSHTSLAQCTTNHNCPNNNSSTSTSSRMYNTKVSVAATKHTTSTCSVPTKAASSHIQAVSAVD